jgi:sugar-specific transcriptional regulator TrmB
MDFDQGVKVFNKLGLTLSQAKIYVSLIQLGRSSIRQVSNKTGIAREQVYRIMPNLLSKGLVEKELSIPAIYNPIPSKEAISLLLQLRSQETQNIAKETEVFLEQIEDIIPQFRDGESTGFIIIPKMRAFAIRIKNELDKTKKNLDFLTTCPSFNQGVKDFRQSIEDYATKGVKARAILTDCDENINYNNFSSILEWMEITKGEVRYISHEYPMIIAIHDNKNLLMSIDPTKTLTKSAGLFTNNRSIVTMAKHHFETLWRNSKKIKIE